MATCPLCKTDLVQKVPQHKALRFPQPAVAPFRCMGCSCYFIILNPAEFSQMMKMKQKLESRKQQKPTIQDAAKTPEGVQPVMPPLAVLAAAANRVVDLQNALVEAINLAKLGRQGVPWVPVHEKALTRIEKILTAKVPQQVVETLQKAVAAGQLEELPAKGGAQ